MIHEANNEKKSKSQQYKDEVFEMLQKNENPLSLSLKELKNLQLEIEKVTMSFDDVSMFHSTPNLIMMLINENEKQECAKDYLKKRLKDKEDLEMLSVFGQYPIEALIVYVLSTLFSLDSESTMIRVSSLVERNVRLQSIILKDSKFKQSSSTVLDEVQKSD